jgi:hypothetical protein
VTIDVSASVPGGISQQTVRTVSGNCKTLKILDFGFEE